MSSIFKKPSIFTETKVEPKAPVPVNIDRQAQMAAIAEAGSVEDIGRRRMAAKEELATDSAALRNRLAHQSKARRLKAYENAFMETDPNSPEAPILVEAAYREAEQIPENRAPTSIEEGYVDTVETLREESLLEGTMFERDFREEKRLVAIRREQVNNVLAGWAEDRERRPAFWWFVERLGYQGVPFAVSSQQTGLTSEATTAENLAFSGERIVQEAREFQRAMATLSEEEWQSYLDNMVNEILERTSASGLADLTAREDLLGELLDPLPPEAINTFNFLDNLLPFVGPLISKSARTVSTTAAATRRVNRPASIRASVESLSAQRVGGEGIVPADELVPEVLPRIVNPEPDGVSAAGVIVRDVEPIDELGDMLESQRLFDDEINAAYDAAESALVARYGGPQLTDIQRVETNLRTGQTVRDVEGILVRPNGAAYKTEQTAGLAAQRMGLSPEDVVNIGEDQGWAIRVSSPVDESGFYTTNLELTVRNAVGRLFSSGELRLGDLGATEAHRAQGRLNRIEETLVRPVNKAVRRLSGGERTSLQNIWNKGASEGRWFNRQEFDQLYLRSSNGAKPSERAWDAYQQIIRVNNIEHSLRNDALFAELQTQGVRSIDIEAPFINRGTWNGRVVSKTPPNARVFNAETGEMLDELTEVPEGFELLSLRSGPEELSVNGHPLNHVLVRRTNIQERALQLNQLNYKPGGHRFYDANYWVRRGTDQLTRPFTYIAGRTRREVKEWADTMENGRLAFLRMVREEGVSEDVAADRVVEEFFGDSKAFPNRDEFLTDMQRDADSPFEITLDREMPRGEPGSGFAEASPLEAHLSRQGQMYHSRRGEEAVRDYMGEEAFVMDLGDVLGRSLTNVARISGYSDFKIQMVNRWLETYKDILPSGVSGESNMARFLRGLDGSVENVDQHLLESARAQHDAIKTALAFRDEGTLRVQVMQRQLTDWVANQDRLRGIGIKDPVKFAGDMNDWLRTTNPKAALMGAAFDLKLGMFNIAQIPLQMTHFAVMWQLSKSGAGFNAGAFANSLPAFVYATNRGNPEGILDSLVSSGMHRTMGMNEAEYREMMRMMRASGKIDVNGRYLAIAELGTDINPTAGTGFFRKLRDAGRIPFSATESSMRASAFMMAWRETRKLFPDAATTSRRFQDEVLNRQRKLTFSMDGELPAAWQKGAAAVPTQFWGYFTRMNEAMFSGKFGDLIRNDAGQLSVNTPRMRLMVGQSFLYGPLAGLPLMNILPWASEKVGLTDPSPHAADLGTVEGFIDRGFIDHVYQWMTGKDVLVSQRYAAGTFAGDFLRSLFGESPYGGVTAGEVLGGASISIAADVFGDATEFMGDMVNYLRRAAHGNVEGVSVPRESFIRMANNVSSINNSTKALMIRNFGILQSSNQTPLVAGLDPSYSIEALFSLQPEQMRELSQNFNYLEDREQTVSDVADVINRYNIMILENPDRIGDLNNELSAFISLIHSEDPGLVIEALPRTVDSRMSLFDYTQQRVQRMTQRDQLNKALQDG